MRTHPQVPSRYVELGGPRLSSPLPPVFLSLHDPGLLACLVSIFSHWVILPPTILQLPCACDFRDRCVQVASYQTKRSQKFRNRSLLAEVLSYNMAETYSAKLGFWKIAFQLIERDHVHLTMYFKHGIMKWQYVLVIQPYLYDFALLWWVFNPFLCCWERKTCGPLRRLTFHLLVVPSLCCSFSASFSLFYFSFSKTDHFVSNLRHCQHWEFYILNYLSGLLLIWGNFLFPNNKTLWL